MLRKPHPADGELLGVFLIGEWPPRVERLPRGKYPKTVLAENGRVAQKRRASCPERRRVAAKRGSSANGRRAALQATRKGTGKGASASGRRLIPGAVRGHTSAAPGEVRQFVGRSVLTGEWASALVADACSPGSQRVDTGKGASALVVDAPCARIRMAMGHQPEQCLPGM